jgi:hypothetical protein
MLYVCPPKGDHYPDAATFGAAIRRTAGNIAVTMGRCNKLSGAHGMPSIPVLRLCLFSSAIYNSWGLSPNEIAAQIYGGLRDILEKDDCGLTEIQLPVDGGKLFDVIQRQA